MIKYKYKQLEIIKGKIYNSIITIRKKYKLRHINRLYKLRINLEKCIKIINSRYLN